MSLLIKGMKMPEYGMIGVFISSNGNVYDSMDNIIGTIVPVPSHGRLIDEKWIKEYITDTIKGFEEMNRSDLQNYSLIAGLRTVEVMIEHAPTVIEAEE